MALGLGIALKIKVSIVFRQLLYGYCKVSWLKGLASRCIKVSIAFPVPEAPGPRQLLFSQREWFDDYCKVDELAFVAIVMG